MVVVRHIARHNCPALYKNCKPEMHIRQALLQTTGGKDEPNIIFMQTS